MTTDAHTDKTEREDLRLALHLEWIDHLQTRRQTWKALEASALALAAFVVAGLRIQSFPVLAVLGSVVALMSIAGAAVSWHHRNAQVRKFSHIDRLEKALGLHAPGLLDDVHPPRPPRALDVVDPRRMNTPLFIFRAHLLIMAFVVLYLAGRWATG